jgi:cellulose synthase/poly-beta-1,6-N-acetylglucosamine synthase-like glycosyltransferase
MMTIFSIILAIAYALLILRYRQMWKAGETHMNAGDPPKEEFISVIVPCRNEERNIESCLTSLLTQDYPSTQREVIVVDDHSTDTTAVIAETFSDQGVRLIRMSEAQDGQGKKAAISRGVAASKGSIILATDADCTAPRGWMRSMAGCRRINDDAFIGGPVMFRSTQQPLDIFQTLDFLSLQGITAASVAAGFHGMSNGANMGFTREAFDAVGGYKDIDHIASGDDMLLMQKIQEQYPDRISYCRSSDAIISTKPEAGLRDFLRQRIRWASKAAYYRDKRILPVLVIVYLHNLSLLVLLASGIFGYTSALRTGCLLLLFKTVVELSFLMPVATFFRLSRLLWWFPLAQPFHILYTMVSGLFGQLGTYQWKGRTVR